MTTANTPTNNTATLPQVLRQSDPSLNDGRREAAFIDIGVADWQTLADGVRPGVEVVLIGGEQDGLAQMAEWAQNHAGYGAIHLLSHGADATLSLGNNTLTNASLTDASVKANLARLGQALTADGDLLLYGCKIAADAEGQLFIANLAAATGADVAASDDLTGSAWMDGDWDLEVAVGEVEASTGLDATIAQVYAGNPLALNSAPTIAIGLANGSLISSGTTGMTYQISLNDLNSDGKVDIAYITDSAKIGFLLGNGDGSFSTL